MISDTSPGFQPFGYAGGLYDPDTGLNHFLFRDYSAESGTWTARDPVGFAGGSTSLYAYVGNDPINWNDPTGTGPLPPWATGPITTPNTDLFPGNTTVPLSFVPDKNAAANEKRFKVAVIAVGGIATSIAAFPAICSYTLAGSTAKALFGTFLFANNGFLLAASTGNLVNAASTPQGTEVTVIPTTIASNVLSEGPASFVDAMVGGVKLPTGPAWAQGLGKAAGWAQKFGKALP